MKGANTELGTKGRPASSVLVSSVVAWECLHQENFEYDF